MELPGAVAGEPERLEQRLPLAVKAGPDNDVTGRRRCAHYVRLGETACERKAATAQPPVAARDLPNLVGSPHHSSIVAGAMVPAARLAAENVHRHLRDETVTGIVRRAEYR